MGAKINRENYEHFVVDFIDGNLSTDETDMFLSFLDENPDIKEDIQGLAEVIIQADSGTFESKNELKKQEIISVNDISESTFEEAFIAYNEQDLDESVKSDVKRFLDINPQLEKEFKLHTNLSVSADTTIVYNNKQSLKKRTVLVPARIWSAAAAIILLLGWWFSTPETIDINRQQLSISTMYTKGSSYIPTAEILEHNIPDRYTSKVEPIDFEKESSQRETIYMASLSTRRSHDASLSRWNYATILDQNTDYKVYYVSADESVAKNATPDIKKKSLFASIVSNQWEKLTGSVSRINSNPTKTDDPTYVRVIDRSIKVFNTITGSETLTSKTYNSEGELTGYQVEGRELLLSRNTISGSVD